MAFRVVFPQVRRYYSGNGHYNHISVIIAITTTIITLSTTVLPGTVVGYFVFIIHYDHSSAFLVLSLLLRLSSPSYALIIITVIVLIISVFLRLLPCFAAGGAADFFVLFVEAGGAAARGMPFQELVVGDSKSSLARFR